MSASACLRFTRPPNSSWTTESHLLLREGPLQQPGNDREVLALVEGGQDHRVDVLGRAFRHGEVIRTRYWERWEVLGIRECQNQE